MSKIDNDTIYQTIKEDNLNLFSAYIEGKENLSFGRFPILTICYMFEARKIIGKYRELLGSITKYQVVPEPFELYKKFRELSGKVLRLYRGEEKIVSPLEMLAILKKDNLVRKYYKSFYVSESAKKNLKKIYKFSSLKVQMDDSEITIEKRPMERVQKRVYGWSLVLSMSFVLLITLVYTMVVAVSGMGISLAPYKIFNEGQFFKALCSNGNYVLMGDITLSKLKKDVEFSGVLDGAGYTIYLDSIPNGSLIEKNSGSIKNLNIVYSNIDSSISMPTSLFVGENEGDISRVNISCDSISLLCNKSLDNDVSLAGFATTNRGNILGSTIKLKCSFSAIGDGECFISGFAINNSGNIKNCSFLSDSSITTTEADASGFVVNNEKTGLIYNCINDCDISQTSSLNGWSPTLAGIVLTNYGAIQNSVNHSAISIVSDNAIENAQGIVFAGGISANNYGSIVKSLNSGDINIVSDSIMVYAGGVSAYSGYYIEEEQTVLSTITNCGAIGNLDITTIKEDVFVFAGGISGYLYGGMSECYSMSTFTNGYDEERWFIGTALGSAYLQYQIFGSVICISAEENYVLSLDNVDYQIGSLISNGTIVSVGLDTSNNEVQTLEYESQIMQKEVYWSE